ncbi:MAG TPA: 2TM domain-containing protein [Fimbriimonadaceae bacterium]|nr:2TM domain-containing protein [Fimbriimonadaceae bacterium]
MPESRFYSEQEADQILRKAVENSVVTGAMTRDRLLATAAELGISEDAILRAEQELAAQRDDEERKRTEARELKEYRAYRWRKACSSLSGWVSTSILLIGFNLLTSHTISWAIWPVGIWGLVELGEVVQALMTPATHGERFERWRRKHRRAEPSV